MIIAIDGPAGTGKSTVARLLAKRLGIAFFDTGAMYRAFAWMVDLEKVNPADPAAVCLLVPRFQYRVGSDASGQSCYWVGETNVSKVIRTPRISSLVSQIATYPEVRKALVRIQRKYGEKCDAVFEGRDIGTVVFPQADLKIFLTARAEVRAQRRFEELLQKFPDFSSTFQFDTILKEIEERDLNDSTRAVSPLKQAEDAFCIDTSDQTIEEVVLAIIELIPEKKKYPPMKWSYWLVYWMARIFFKVCFRLQIHGLTHFRPGPGVIVANHTSNYDPPVLSISCPEEVHFLAKEKLFQVPFLGFLIRILNSHPVSRSANDTHVFRQLIQLLQKGKVILFPEGSRSKDGTLQPLERGLGFVVQKAECPIFPAYISGTYAAWPSGRRFPKLFGKIHVVFGTPIEWHDCAELDRRRAQQKILEQTAASLRDLQSWLDGGAEGTPP